MQKDFFTMNDDKSVAEVSRRVKFGLHRFDIDRSWSRSLMRNFEQPFIFQQGVMLMRTPSSAVT